MHINIFCQVVDNLGDIGVCWRLARQLDVDYGCTVDLWVDNLSAFARIEPQANDDEAEQTIGNVVIRHWADPFEGDIAIGEVVIEAFACGIPEEVIAAMAEMNTPPAWFNLEYLSAEPWVEGCHNKPSQHPRFPLTTTFFFPGFTDKTGGLIREHNLVEARDFFQNDAIEFADWAEGLGLPTAKEEGEQWVSLFCYPSAPVALMLQDMANGEGRTRLLVPEGVAKKAIDEFVGAPFTAGMEFVKGNLTIHSLPYTDQAGYDRLLWACDLNFVRGEDSFVRAQWAAKPFIWHIYPQEENIHFEKLQSFLSIYGQGLGVDARETLDFAQLMWNQSARLWPEAASRLRAHQAELEAHAVAWAASKTQETDLAHRLLARVNAETTKDD